MAASSGTRWETEGEKSTCERGDRGERAERQGILSPWRSFGGVLIRSRAVAGGGNGEVGGADTQQLVSQRRRQSNLQKGP
jgi:hypothetical protein